jgi:hypothetical protein
VHFVDEYRENGFSVWTNRFIFAQVIALQETTPRFFHMQAIGKNISPLGQAAVECPPLPHEPPSPHPTRQMPKQIKSPE